MSADLAQSAKLSQLPMADFIFGTTCYMQEVRTTAEAASRDSLPVLIEGESGTGKEVVARYIHLSSAGADGPFVRVNCGAIPAQVLEGEIFGRARLLNNDLHREMGKGSVALAAGGTLFLDEILEMDLALQERFIQCLSGGGGQDRFDPRVVCASSIDLETAVSQGRALEGWLTAFGHRIRLLPLRDRKQDIPHLSQYLAEKFARNFGRTTPLLSVHVLEAFAQWNWPGNIRELENWIARIVIFGTEEAIGLDFRRQMRNREGATTAARHPVRVNSSRLRRARRHC